VKNNRNFGASTMYAAVSPATRGNPLKKAGEFSKIAEARIITGIVNFGIRISRMCLSIRELISVYGILGLQRKEAIAEVSRSPDPPHGGPGFD
jgi:hypothetical protein